MKTQHTKTQYPPRPWQLIEEYPAGHYIADANGIGISQQMDRNIKNYVINCVNMHEELVNTVKLCQKYMLDADEIDISGLRALNAIKEILAKESEG